MIFNKATRTIETPRLLLRPFRREDACLVAELCNNYNVYKSTLSLPYPYTKECAEEWIKHQKENLNVDKSYEFAVTSIETGELYGCVSLSHSLTHRNGELGYWIGEPYWGNGYATEAAEAMIAFAFQEKEYHRVYARHFASNPASGRVMEKAGMMYEGVQKGHLYKLDTYEDVVLYGMTAETGA